MSEVVKGSMMGEAVQGETMSEAVGDKSNAGRW